MKYQVSKYWAHPKKGLFWKLFFFLMIIWGHAVRIRGYHLAVEFNLLYQSELTDPSLCLHTFRNRWETFSTCWQNFTVLIDFNGLHKEYSTKNIQFISNIPTECQWSKLNISPQIFLCVYMLFWKTRANMLI